MFAPCAGLEDLRGINCLMVRGSINNLRASSRFSIGMSVGNRPLPGSAGFCVLANGASSNSGVIGSRGFIHTSTSNIIGVGTNVGCQLKAGLVGNCGFAIRRMGVPSN